MNRCLAKVPAAALVAMCCSLLLAMPRAAQAVPVLISTEGLPGIDVAQRDSEGRLRLFEAEDDNADGMISLVADLDPLAAAYVHIKSGPAASDSACFTIESGDPSIEPIPFFITGTEERVITHWNSLPTIPFTLGQPFSVSGGQIPGLDAVLYLSPGIGSAADIVDLDLTTLPLYTGPAQVGGLLRFQVIPEPSCAMLLAVAAACGLASLRFTRRRRGQGSSPSARPSGFVSRSLVVPPPACFMVCGRI